MTVMVAVLKYVTDFIDFFCPAQFSISLWRGSGFITLGRKCFQSEGETYCAQHIKIYVSMASAT